MGNYELTHHGVKGMKWGIRRSKKQLGYGRGRDDDDVDSHEDSKKVRDGKNPRAMSDAELRARINRIQMEKQYSQLTAKEKSAGRKFVDEVLLNVGKQLATKYVTQAATKGIEKIIGAGKTRLGERKTSANKTRSDGPTGGPFRKPKGSTSTSNSTALVTSKPRIDIDELIRLGRKRR